LPHILSKIRKVAMFLILDLEEIFNTEFEGMCTAYPRTELRIPDFGHGCQTNTHIIFNAAAIS
jgi:hypothetical protein